MSLMDFMMRCSDSSDLFVQIIPGWQLCCERSMANSYAVCPACASYPVVLFFSVSVCQTLLAQHLLCLLPDNRVSHTHEHSHTLLSSVLMSFVALDLVHNLHKGQRRGTQWSLDNVTHLKSWQEEVHEFLIWQLCSEGGKKSQNH